NDTVDATSATPNAPDILDGGGGYNTLALFGSGNFDLSGLAQFTNFQEVDLTNITGGQSNLTLRNGIDLTVNVGNESGSGGTIHLASGATTLNLSSTSSNYTVYASTGTATINVNGSYNNDRFYLSSGDVTINISGGVYNYVYTSSGKATVNFGGTSYNNNIFLDGGSLNYNDAFTASTYLGQSSYQYNVLRAQGFTELD